MPSFFSFEVFLIWQPNLFSISFYDSTVIERHNYGSFLLPYFVKDCKISINISNYHQNFIINTSNTIIKIVPIATETSDIIITMYIPPLTFSISFIYSPLLPFPFPHPSHHLNMICSFHYCRDAMRAIERASDVRSSFVATTGPKLTIVKGVPLDCLFRGDITSPSDAPGIAFPYILLHCSSQMQFLNFLNPNMPEKMFTLIYESIFFFLPFFKSTIDPSEFQRVLAPQTGRSCRESVRHWRPLWIERHSGCHT